MSLPTKQLNFSANLLLILILLTEQGEPQQHRHPIRHARIIGPARHGWMVQHASIRPKGPVLAHCYSCANHELRVYWYHLQTWYNAPRNFTDRCITMNRRDCQQIALEPCQSQCVTLRQQKTVGGHSVGHHVIRGCLSSLFRWNIMEKSEIASALSKPRDVCYNVRLSQLLPTHGGSLRDMSDNKVNMCVCYGDRCNRASSTIAKASSHLLPAIICVIYANLLR